MNQRVCYKNHIYSDHLNYQDKLGVDLWYMSGTGYDVDCYLWCTPDGKLPSSINSKADANQISALVSIFYLLKSPFAQTLKVSFY